MLEARPEQEACTGREEPRWAELLVDVVPYAEPISPELVLVSPELAAMARAALPDRPWEAFLPAADKALALRMPATLPDSSVAAVAADAVVDMSHARSRKRPRVPVGLMLLVAFAGLVAAGSVLPVRDAPTLGPLPASAGTNPVPAPTLPPRTQIVTVLPRVSPTLPAIRLYSMSNGKGFLRVDTRKRTIVELQAILPCAGTVVVRHVPVAANGTFRVLRHAGLGARVPVTLQGRANRKHIAHGTIRVTGGTCRGAELGFVARIG